MFEPSEGKTGQRRITGLTKTVRCPDWLALRASRKMNETFAFIPIRNAYGG
ncbi:MAG: hypothetical protein ACXVCM_00240 [Ktedonobacteraceae bacterium]